MGEGGLICIPLSGVGLPGVNLIIYKGYLRMMGYLIHPQKDGDISRCFGEADLHPRLNLGLNALPLI
jgi:hypothetical protein